jgi:hypothetical protein
MTNTVTYDRVMQTQKTFIYDNDKHEWLIMEQPLIKGMTPKDYLHKLLLSKGGKSELKKLSNDEWQIIFSYMKSINVPTTEKKLKRHNAKPIVVMRRWSLSDNDGNFDTLDNTYVKFINDVLGQLRKGKIDYCYYIYQISDLLRFIPDLNAELKDGIFYVSVNKKISY